MAEEVEETLVSELLAGLFALLIAGCAASESTVLITLVSDSDSEVGGGSYLRVTVNSS